MATKLIIGYTLKDKTYGEVLHAIEYIDEQHKLAKHKLERLTFDAAAAEFAFCSIPLFDVLGSNF